MKKKVFVVQESRDGIVSSPRIFLDELHAKQCYTRFVNEVYDTDFSNKDEAESYLVLQADDYIIGEWITEIEDYRGDWD